MWKNVILILVFKYYFKIRSGKSSYVKEQEINDVV